MDCAYVWPFLKFALIPTFGLVGLKFVGRVQRSWLRAFVKHVLYFWTIVSAVGLVISIPTGSIDVSDLWGFMKLAIIPFLLVLAVITSWRMDDTVVPGCLKMAASLFLFPAGLFCLLMCLVETGCVKQTPPLYSPDGSHLAFTVFVGGGTSTTDQTTVLVRRSWVPVATQVFSAVNPSYSPKMNWLDNSHLLLRYWKQRPGETTCSESAGSIHVVCESFVDPPLN